MSKLMYSLKGLKKARQRNGLTQEQLADKLDVTLKTVRNWEQGLSIPQNLEMMIRISELLNCDLDYLTGNLEESTHDIHFVHEMTGLSEGAINKISDPELKHPMGKILSHLIESEHFKNLLTSYKTFLEASEKVSDDDPEEPEYTIDENHRVSLNYSQAAQHFKRNVLYEIECICDEDYYRQLGIAEEKAHKKKIERFLSLAKEEEVNNNGKTDPLE